ncbi:transcriptional regulator AraC family [Photobacterium aphoticum]|uniref:Transcriptional regulator AraC family n=1 Tax=Photobacterium aphoticum TaxID=754436 RepID=A0A090QM29_9GAMM|nr:transcriptional regulator AraC family [Photobacterium aphoticum]
MAFIDENTRFDADTIDAHVVGIAAEVGQHDSGMHQHTKGQLLYAPQGCMRFAFDNSLCVLPPTKAVWIPPHTPHRATMTNVVAYRSLYFSCEDFEACPSEIVMMEVNDLLKALINTMALWPWDKPKEEMALTTALFWECFHGARREQFQLPLPSSSRFETFCQLMMKEDFLPPLLSKLTDYVGASTKTITRQFKTETGMSYQDWRQQWRLLKAIELLSQQRPVCEVAHALDFSSDSAFIAFFKQHTGQTPRQFIHG